PERRSGNGAPASGPGALEDGAGAAVEMIRAGPEAGAPASRGCRPSTAFAMAAMCSGVLPQQPPAMFTRPLEANSPRKFPMSAGVRSNPVGDSGFGNPAFG